ETPPYRELGASLQRMKRYPFALQKPMAMAARASKPMPPGVNPYRGLPHYQYWRRSIERMSIEDVDPVIHASFQIRRSDRVATAGSCFAQHVSRALRRHGFNYFVAEAPKGMSPDEARAKGYGVFSA